MLKPVVFDCNHANPIGWHIGGEAAGFIALKAAGFVGGFLKVRQGIGFSDPAFVARRDLMRQNNLLVGGYDFSTHDNVAENVKDFLLSTGADPSLAHCLDFEDNKSSPMTGAMAREFLDRVDQATGHPCWIYGGNRIIEQISNTDLGEDEFWTQHPLWLCSYKTNYALRDTDLETLKLHIVIPKPWTKWTLLQYTGDGIGPLPHSAPGLEQGADLNVYDGTAEQLAAEWLGQGVTDVLAA
jgi:GH25 family lysozyme M1 (1,4-beta-N-acetylmuramidase)